MKGQDLFLIISIVSLAFVLYYKWELENIRSRLYQEKLIKKDIYYITKYINRFMPFLPILLFKEVGNIRHNTLAIKINVCLIILAVNLAFWIDW